MLQPSKDNFCLAVLSLLTLMGVGVVAYALVGPVSSQPIIGAQISQPQITLMATPTATSTPELHTLVVEVYDFNQLPRSDCLGKVMRLGSNANQHPKKIIYQQSDDAGRISWSLELGSYEVRLMCYASGLSQMIRAEMRHGVGQLKGCDQAINRITFGLPHPLPGQDVSDSPPLTLVCGQAPKKSDAR